MGVEWVEIGGCRIACGDALAVLPALADASVDAVVTDPPYNCGVRYGDYGDSLPPIEYRAWLRSVLAACPAPELVYTPGTRNVWSVDDVLEGTGYWPHRMLAWHRREFAGDKWNGGPAMSWEPVVWASRRDKPLFNTIFGHWGRDLLTVDSHRTDPMRDCHPCPKPLKVMLWLAKLFVPKGGRLLDPFMGTGTSMIAAMMTGCSAIGIERDPAYFATARRRLEECHGKGGLFEGQS